MRSAASGDQRKPIAPVVAVAGPQPHALAVALDDQAVAVVLDFVDPLRAVRDFGRRGSGCKVQTQMYACGVDSWRMGECKSSIDFLTNVGARLEVAAPAGVVFPNYQLGNAAREDRMKRRIH